MRVMPGRSKKVVARKWRVFLMAILIICFSSIPPARASTDIESVVEANNGFALDLYRQIASRDLDGNIFFSPASIYTGLAMTYAGAQGNTASQMAKTLHVALPGERLHPALANMWAALKGTQLAVANGLWGQAGLTFRREFLDMMEHYYGGDFRRIDFRQPGSSLVINRWIEEKTRGRIKDLLQPHGVGPMTSLVLTNAVYFKDKWLSEFDPASTAKRPFHLPGGETVLTQMMSQKGKFPFFEDDTLQVLEMPYAGGLSMVILLPREGVAFEAQERSLTAQGLRKLMDRLSEEEVDLEMPKFKMTRSYDLKEHLIPLGMKDAFGETADFSGMAVHEKLFISAAVHKAFVEVNEEGTEAAAATGVRMELMASESDSKAFVFKADRPFIFMIRDRQTGSLIFAGRMTNPAKD